MGSRGNSKKPNIEEIVSRENKCLNLLGLNICVVGSGPMGAGLALLFLEKGLNVFFVVKDKNSKGKVIQILKKEVSKLNENGLNDLDINRINITDRLEEAVAKCSVIIETVNENIELKRSILLKISGVAAENSIIATNTSSLSVSELSKSVKNPSRFLGMHFFNPPTKMKLLELIKSPDTSQETIARSERLALTWGKETILVKDSPGFATSRLSAILSIEAMKIVEEGVASVEDVDKAMTLGFNHPMGPLRLGDFVGLDVRLRVIETCHKGLNAERFSPPNIIRDLVKDGNFGRKSGKGFYIWKKKV